MAPLLGVLFAIFIGLLAIRPYLAYQQQSFQMIQASNTASQFRQIINAATTYVQDNCVPDPSTGNIPSSCSNIPLSALQTAGLLPANVTSSNNAAGLNPYGQQWSIAVSQVSNPNNPQGAPQLQALLYSSGGSTIPPQIAPEIAAQTGQEGGFVPTPSQYAIYNVPANTAVGAYGHWAAPAPSGATQGHLVALLDVGTGQNGENDNDYLYRTAVPGDTNNSLNTMQTTLSMGGNAISGATSVTTQDASGDTTIASSSAAGGAQFSASASAGAASINSSSSSGTANFSASSSSGTASFSASSVSGETGFSSYSVKGPAAYIAEGKDASLSLNGDDTNPNNYGANILLSNTAARGGGSKISLRDAAGANDSLTFISAAQTSGATCTPSQIGTIAPNTDGTGLPLVCVQESTPNASTADTWQSLSGFTQAVQQVLWAANTPYQNNSSRPWSVSSDCLWTSIIGTWIDYSITLYTYATLADYNSGNYSSESHNGVLAAVAASSPSASIIIPPGYYFSYSILPPDESSKIGGVPAGTTCNFSVAY